MSARRTWRARVALVAAVATTFTSLGLTSANAASAADDFELGSGTVFNPGSSRDCTIRQAGSCSLKLDPPGSSFVSARSPVGVPIEGTTTVSFYFYGESNGGNVDSDLHFVLSNGHTVLLHTTAGYNNGVSLLSASGHNVFSSWSSGVWTPMTLTFRPSTSTVTATVNGRSHTVAYPAAASISHVDWYGVRWGSGTPIRYDTLRVENTPSNSAPTTTLVAPAESGSFAYGAAQAFTVRATDPDGDAYTSVVTVRDAGTNAVVRTLPATALTPSGQSATVVADPPLHAGQYTWTARSTDAHGLAGPESAGSSFRVEHLAYRDGRYVALGDSFSSGEGVPEFEDGTGSYGYDRCHRSFRSYSRLISGDANVPTRPEYWACSGALTQHVMSQPFKGEAPQLTRLGPDVTLVTMSVGGNDAGFADVLEKCVREDGCEGPDVMDAYVGKRMDVLDGQPVPPLPANPTPEQVAEHDELSAIVPLRQVYDAVRANAPRAEVVVVGYPKFFSLQEGVDLFGWRFGSRCYNIDWDEQRWMNDTVHAMNEMIKRNLPAGFRYADVENAFDGHHLCDGSPEWMWGVDMQPVEEPPFVGPSPYSFHPNAEGQAAFAEAVRAAIANVPPGRTTHTVNRGQTVRETVPVIPNRPAVDMSARWHGSDIELSLVSPSGRRITRATVAPDVTRATGPTYDSVSVTDPEPGDWTVELYGADVPAEGEEAVLDVVAREPVNAAPVAAGTASLSGRTLTADGGASSDADGTIVRYAWDFGDNGTMSGTTPTASYVYDEPGTYRVTLTVYDDRGAAGFTTFTVVVPRYELTGFAAPLDAAPTLNSVNAGRTVPVKWRVTEAGAPVSDAASFASLTSAEVPCDANAPVDAVDETSDSTAGLQYTGDGWWIYTWATSKTWAGTCRRMTLRLDDGTAKSALFDFR